MREIFRYPKRDNFAIAPDRKRLALQSTIAGEHPFVDSSRILPSQFFHFCATWETGWPFCWNQQMRSANCSCGLFDQFGPDIKLDLIEDENFGGDEPDCATNHQRSERE
jgi:hypothetical protein